jgi:hypothetical protein
MFVAYCLPRIMLLYSVFDIVRLPTIKLLKIFTKQEVDVEHNDEGPETGPCGEGVPPLGGRTLGTSLRTYDGLVPPEWRD